MTLNLSESERLRATREIMNLPGWKALIKEITEMHDEARSALENAAATEDVLAVRVKAGVRLGIRKILTHIEKLEHGTRPPSQLGG